MRGPWRALLERLLQAAERWLPALTRLRQPEALPILLHRRRLYVLPTAFGLGLGLLLAVMTLGALNYDNNPALILAFALASAAHTSLLQGYLALRGLRLAAVHAEPVHAGETLALQCHFDAVEPRERRGLELRREGRSAFFSLPRDGGTVVTLQVPTRQRGWMAVGRIGVRTRRPLGLFVVWSWLHPQARVLVYPRPEAQAPPLPSPASEGRPQRRRSPHEDLHGLRDYRRGDPVRIIAWKRSAQAGRLVVREFETPAGRDVVLDWQALAGLGREQRIARLTRWLLEAERLGLRSELRLPHGRFGPDLGPRHRHRCLRELALLP
ncbi:MAG: membrane protein [Lysobacteraceae bacterium]|nr:MAG: membrane protein [Xanthomonadaceae bacterium]